MLIAREQRQQNVRNNLQPLRLIVIRFLLDPSRRLPFIRFGVARVQFGNDFTRHDRIAQQLERHVVVQNEKRLVHPAVSCSSRLFLLLFNVLYTLGNVRPRGFDLE